MIPIIRIRPRNQYPWTVMNDGDLEYWWGYGFNRRTVRIHNALNRWRYLLGAQIAA